MSEKYKNVQEWLKYREANKIQDPYHEALVLIKVEKLRLDANRETQDKVQAEWEAAVLAMWREKKERRKFSIAKAQEFYPAEYGEIREKFETLARDLGNRWADERDQYEALLKSLAKDAVIPVTTEASKMPEFMYDGAYNSQGFGRERYAHADAQRIADHAITNGIQAFVKCSENDLDVRAGNHEVWAHCDPAAWPILKAKPGQSLKQWLKSCWGSGVNPRVLNPYLPVGLEEKLGIDYFGNDLKGDK